MASGTKTAEAVRDAVAPVLTGLGIDLYDVEVAGAGAGGPGRTVRILVDREGGIDLDSVASATQAVTQVLDDTGAVAGPYELEVSSPGVERSLRRPEHFRMALGGTVSVKHHTSEGPRRVHGVLVDVGDDACSLDVDGETQRIDYSDITAAHTVFEWGPAPRSGRAKRAGAAGSERPKENARS